MNLQLSQHFECIFVVGLFAEFIDFGEDDLALLVHNEDGALIDPGNGIAFAQHAVLFCGLAVRKEITGQREIQLADRFLLPRNVAGN